MRRETLAVLALIPLVSACAAGPGGEARSTPPKQAKSRVAVATPVRRPASPRPLPPPRIQNVPGVEGVIGATPGELTRQFGAPRLDVWEGDARKLQFSGTPCVLDVYLYPLAPGREPQATYVDARRGSDGRDVDRAACVAALRAAARR